MNRSVHPSSSPGKWGRTLFTAGFLIALGIIFGVIVTSGLDLSPQSNAQSYSNISETGQYPLINNNGEIESPFVSVVEKVQDAVVNISARTREETVPWWYRRSGYSTSSGSGFFFREDGYILTNNHVIENAEKLTVRTSTGFQYEAQLVGADPETDLAVLKVKPEEDITAIQFGDSDYLKVGDWAIAIGNPFPQQGLDRTVTVGVISAKGRSHLNFGNETPNYQYYIQTDASINPGNSGGPLLNLRGEVIGVNAAISSPTGGSVGIGFAIPINLARAIVPDLISMGKVQRGWLGVYLNNVTENEAKRQGMDAVKGVMIDSVFIGSPAEKAGIKKGDVVISFNNHEVENASQFSVLVSTVKNGQSVPVELYRNGISHSVNTLIGDRDTFLASGSGQVQPDDFDIYDWMGMELLTFTPEIAKLLSIEHVPGLFVRRVFSGSQSDRASITRGTIILQIGDNTVKTINDVETIAKQLRGSSNRIPLIVQEADGTIARRVLRP
ncbi:MAG: trypsin-like peptidase domain-containing protein [Methanosarcinaceae archaeon]